MGWTHWSSSEVVKLKRAFREGKTDEQIAALIERPITGVKSKRIELGLNRRHLTRIAPQEERQEGYTVIVKGPGIDMSISTDQETARALVGLALQDRRG